jgi:hypothetical protein
LSPSGVFLTCLLRSDGLLLGCPSERAVNWYVFFLVSFAPLDILVVRRERLVFTFPGVPWALNVEAAGANGCPSAAVSGEWTRGKG